MLNVVPFKSEYEEQVRRFNRRLEPARAASFPEQSEPDWLPKKDGLNLYQEYFLAVDEGSVVRGGYILKHQDFVIDGTIQSIADYRFPLSEGIVDRTYNFVGLRLLAHALGRQPRLFALGMGGFEQPLPKMLQAARWGLAPVPFYFRVVRPVALLRNLAPLRRTALRRSACDIAAVTGLGWLAIKSYQAVRPTMRAPQSIACERVEEFAAWSDDLWAACKDRYALIAVRDSTVLRALYPGADKRFIRIKVTREGRVLGWAVLLATQMQGHRHFGRMKVGTLVDCLAAPGDAPIVAASARDVLEAEGVDLIVSNQSHAAWCEALAACGFVAGPTNFLFAASPKLAAPFQPLEQHRPSFHINRGDGDGPIHL
jgi:hypothetical protein